MGFKTNTASILGYLVLSTEKLLRVCFNHSMCVLTKTHTLWFLFLVLHTQNQIA